MSPLIAVLAVLGLVKVVRSATSAGDQPSALLAAGMLPFLAYLLRACAARPGAGELDGAALSLVRGLCRRRPGRHRDPAEARDAAGQSRRRGPLPSAFFCPVFSTGMPCGRSCSCRARGTPPARRGAGASLPPRSSACASQEGPAGWPRRATPRPGQLAYHLKDKAPVAQLTERIRYIHLPGIDAATLGCPALYVELERRSAPALLQERFRSVERLENVTRSHRGVPIATYAVYFVSGRNADPLGR